MGIAPTGKRVTVPVICISRLANNKIVEDFELVDIFGLLQQLGVSSPTGEI
jgi:predicted ester cyclase